MTVARHTCRDSIKGTTMLARLIQRNHVIICCGADPCCHGNEICARSTRLPACLYEYLTFSFSLLAWIYTAVWCLAFPVCVEYDTENCRDQPDRELFVWAVLFSRMRLAKTFWKTCPDQIGAALVANLMLRSMARRAELTEKLQLADELIENARFVYSIRLLNRLCRIHERIVMDFIALQCQKVGMATVPSCLYFELQRAPLMLCSDFLIKQKKCSCCFMVYWKSIMPKQYKNIPIAQPRMTTVHVTCM